MRGRVVRCLGSAGLVVALSVAGCSGGPGSVTPATQLPTSAADGDTVTTSAPSTAAPSPPTEPTAAPPPATPPTSPPPSPTTAPAPTTPTTPSTPPAAQLVELWSGLDVESFDTERKVVALTFDGGASDAGVQDILDTLESEDVPATFFVTGDFARAYPDSVRAMAEGGHPVGNHSDTHPHFPASTNEEIRAELSAAESAIRPLTGAPTAPLFRFPFGDRTPLDITVVNRAGYIPIRWTVDTLGWQGTSGDITAATVRQRVLDTLRPGQVVLMHVGAHPTDGSTLDADALAGIITRLRDRGYDFVTVPELLVDGP